MKQAARKRIVNRLLLSLWAMLTMVLLFSVGLLVMEMMEGGRDPLAAVRRAPALAAPAQPAKSPAAPQEGNRDVLLYFASSDGRLLVPESRAIECGDSTAENCRRALAALIAGPRDVLTPILPATAKVRGVYLLEGGELVVDLSRELLSEYTRLKSASLEALMAYGIVNTLTQNTLQGTDGGPVKQVRLLFEGSPPQEIFPAHIDLTDPIGPDPQWNAPASEQPQNG